MKHWPLLLAAFCLAGSLAAAAAPQPRRITAKRKGHYNVSIRYPYYPEATPVARLANTTLAAWARKGRDDTIAAARKEPPNGNRVWEFSDDTDFSPGLTQPTRLISVLFYSDTYSGGAHGSQTFSPFTFGWVNGKAKRLMLRDFFQPGADFRSVVTAQVMAKLQAEERASAVREGTVTTLTAEQLNRFVVKKTGLTFLFNPYKMGSYADGVFKIELTPQELGPAFKASLLTGR